MWSRLRFRLCYVLQVEKSPFVERLLKKGLEVLYLVEPIDEHTIQNLPDFDGKKFQNAAKVNNKLYLYVVTIVGCMHGWWQEGLDFGEQSEEQKEQQETLEKSYEPLTKWLQEEALKDKVGNKRDSNTCAKNIFTCCNRLRRQLCLIVWPHHHVLWLLDNTDGWLFITCLTLTTIRHLFVLCPTGLATWSESWRAKHITELVIPPPGKSSW